MSKHPKIKCLIIDDEPPAREVLRQHIAGVEALELAGICANAVEGISFLKDNPVDLIFLDIQMPQLLGTSFLRTLKSPPKVIFTTAYRKYALEGFELDAVDYLLKPVSFERFLKGVNKILQVNYTAGKEITDNREESREPASPFLYFRADRKMVKVLLQDILFIEALKDYIKIVTTTRTIVTKYVLATLAELLPAEEFLRIHKSYIVALSKIDSFNAETLQVGRYELPIGRLYKFEVTRILNQSSPS